MYLIADLEETDLSITEEEKIDILEIIKSVRIQTDEHVPFSGAGSYEAGQNNGSQIRLTH